MTLGAYIWVFRKRWRTVAVVTLTTLLAAVAVTLLIPKTYVAQTTSFVSIASAKGGTPDALYQNSQYALNQVQSYPDIVTSPDVLSPVIADLGLDMSVPELRKHITATNPLNTVLLNISATSTSPKQAQAIANAAADHLGSLVESLETPTGNISSPVKVTTAVPAALPVSPASPRPLLNLVLGLLLGLGLGALAAAVRERLDTTVKSLTDLQDLTGTIGLGAVRSDRMVKQHPLLLTRPHNVAVEEFRSIRTALRYVDVDNPPRQIVMSSAIAGEGKSVLACNIATIMAQAHLNVCLVEADLRRPRAAQYLGLDGSIGLTEVVAGERDLDEVLVSWNRGQLTVLPAGIAPSDPGHLLGSRAMTDLFAKLRARFDLVLIDAPPLLPVSDAAIMGAMSDGVILVARYGHVTKEQLRKAIESLQAVDARLIGTVLNAVPLKERRSTHGTDYGYASEAVPPLKTNA